MSDPAGFKPPRPWWPKYASVQAPSMEMVAPGLTGSITLARTGAREYEARIRWRIGERRFACVTYVRGKNLREIRAELDDLPVLVREAIMAVTEEDMRAMRRAGQLGAREREYVVAAEAALNRLKAQCPNAQSF